MNNYYFSEIFGILYIFIWPLLTWCLELIEIVMVGPVKKLEIQKTISSDSKYDLLLPLNTMKFYGKIQVP